MQFQLFLRNRKIHSYNKHFRFNHLPLSYLRHQHCSTHSTTFYRCAYFSLTIKNMILTIMTQGTFILFYTQWWVQHNALSVMVLKDDIFTTIFISTRITFLVNKKTFLHIVKCNHNFRKWKVPTWKSIFSFTRLKSLRQPIMHVVIACLLCIYLLKVWYVKCITKNF